MEITKEVFLEMMGSTDGFSAEAVREQLDIRAKSVSQQMDKFRKENGIVVQTKGEVKA